MGSEASATIKLVAKDGKFNRAMKKVSKRMEKVRKKMEQVAAAARIMFVAGIAAVTAAVVAYGSFEKKMARVKALTDSTGASFASLESIARQLGKTTIFTANQAASAMGFLAQAGFRVKEVIGVLPDVLDLAAAGQLDMATAAQISAKIIRGMKIPITEFQHAVDVLAKAFTTSATNLQDLGNAMKFVGPVAQVSGMSIERTVVALQALADSGLNATLGGTALRRVIVSLQATKFRKFFEEAGFAVADAEGKLRPLPELVGDLETALAGVGDETEQTAILFKLFGLRGGPAMQILLAKGQSALERMERALKGAGGTAKKIADIQLDTLFGSFKILVSIATEAAIALGEGLRPTMALLADTGKTVIGVFNSMSQATKGAAAEMLLYGTVLFGVVATLPKMIALGAFLFRTFLKGNRIIQFAVTKMKLWGVTTSVAMGAAVIAIGLLITKWIQLNRQLDAYQKKLEQPTEALNRMTAASRELNATFAKGGGDSEGEKPKSAEEIEARKKITEEEIAGFDKLNKTEIARAAALTEERISAREKIAVAADEAIAALNRENDAVNASTGVFGVDIFGKGISANVTTDANDRRIATLEKQKQKNKELLAVARERLKIQQGISEERKRQAEADAESATAAREQVKRDKPGLVLLKELTDKLNIVRDTITEGQLEILDLKNLGIGSFLLGQIAAKRAQLTSATDAKERADTLEQEADSLKKMARTDKERLADELARVEVLKLANFLTAQEAAQIEAKLRGGDEGSLQGRLTSGDALFRRITEAAGGRKSGTTSPAATTAKATTATAKSTKKSAELMKLLGDNVEALLEFARNALSGGTPVGVYGGG